MIKVEGLVKQYSDFTAVDHLDLVVDEGKLFAFLGPNGAGKSTTINIICTLLEKTAGRIEVAGYEVGRQSHLVRKEIGLVFQESILDSLLTVRENLETRAKFYGMRGPSLKNRIQVVAEIMGIGEILNRPYGLLSGGQRRRVDIARAMMNKPRILFLDEPTTGLDPQTRIKVWETVRRLQHEEKLTVFLTTHYMEEAAGADDVAIIDHGSIVVRGTPNELKDRYASDTIRIYTDDPPGLWRTLTGMGILNELRQDSVHVSVKESLEALPILQRLSGKFTGFEVIKGSMDDVFIHITGKTIREGGDDRCRP
jgi:multidrug/hemolysin transport system ATP-binding protein